MSRATVVLLPGFNGRADQPVLVKLSKRLEALGFRCERRAPPRLKLTPDLGAYVQWLARELALLDGPLVLVGRSFGGRIALRTAPGPSISAIILLGFPIRPPGKKRPLDEAALSAVSCPLFIAQGTKDPLGPLKLIKQFAPRAELHEVKGAGHGFGAKEGAALDAAAAWLDRTLR
jgi:predicted alpha/beta-hydrolase family hydrolase